MFARVVRFFALCLAALLVPNLAGQTTPSGQKNGGTGEGGGRTETAPVPGENPTEGAPGCSPLEDCCEVLKAISEGGGGAGAEAVVGVDGGGAGRIIHVGPEKGSRGAANCYGAFFAFAFTEDWIHDILYDWPGFVPFPGASILASSRNLCDLQPIEMDCNYQQIQVIVGVNPQTGAPIHEEQTVCVCSPAQVGGGGGGGPGAAPARFKFDRQIDPSLMESSPLVFLSESSASELWHHNIGLPLGEQFIEVKHSDGTVATFEVAQDLSATFGIAVWRLARVLDPYDNSTFFDYEPPGTGQGRLIRIRYPSGVEEWWDYSPTGAPFEWPSSPYAHSFLKFTYYDSVSQQTLDDASWGMVFENVNGRTHFHGRLCRVYYPKTRFVESTLAGGFQYFDLEASPPTTDARPVYDFLYDASGRLESLREGRSWNTLFYYFTGATSTTTDLQEYVHVDYVSAQDDRVLRHSYPLLGGRFYEYSYPGAAGVTRQLEAPPDLRRTTRLDADGNRWHYEYSESKLRTYRIEFEPADDATGRPRAHTSQAVKDALGANFREEPTLLRSDYFFDETCICSKPKRVEVTGFVPGQSPVTREFSFEYYPTNRLLKKAIRPNPSTAPGAPATVETEYTYASATGGGALWSARVLDTVTTPDGVWKFTYVWRDRANLASHGRMPERIRRAIDDVRIQTDLDSTGVTDIDWVVDLGFVGSPGYPSGWEPVRLNGRPAIVEDGDGVKSYLRYDSNGNLELVTSGGVSTGFDYDAWGRLTKVTLNEGAGSLESDITIDQGYRGEVFGASSTVSGKLIASQMAYDRWGNLSVVRRWNRDSAGVEPHEFGEPPSGTTRDWVETQFIFQWRELIKTYRDRRPINQHAGSPFDADPLAWFLVRETSYTPGGKVSEIRHPNGSTTEYEIDGFGTLYTAKTSGGSPLQEFQHSRSFVNALLERVAVFEGGTESSDPKLWTLIERNGAGAVTRMTEPVVDAGLVPAGYSGSRGGAVHDFSIDDLGRVVRATVGSSGVTLMDVERSFDQLGRLMKETNHVILSDGTALPGVAHQRIWSYALGKATQLGFRKATGVPAAHTSTYAYDSISGRLTSVTDTGGNSVSAEYHAGTDYVRAVGRHLVDGQGGGAVDYRTEYDVDPFGRVTVLRDMGDGPVPIEDALVHQFFYNSLGLTDRYVDPMGREQVYLPDALGRLIEHVRVGTGGSNPRTVSVYTDHLGSDESMVERRDGLNHSTYTYFDYLGRPVAVRLPGSGTRPTDSNKHVPLSYYAEYDLLSRLTDVYDGDNGHTKLWYNGPGHLIQREVLNANGPSQAWISNFNVRDLISRDALGRMMNTGSFAVDGGGNYSTSVLEAFEFDSLGRIHQESYLPYAFGNLLEVESSYTGGGMFRTGLDYRDNLASNSFPLEMTLTADSVGRLANIHWNQDPGGGGQFTQLAEYTYRGTQKRYRKTFLEGVNKVETYFDYDAYGRLQGIHDIVNGGATPISEYDYEYDDAGNLLKEIYQKQPGGGGGVGDRFSYDHFHRLTVAWLGLDTEGMNATEAELLAGTKGSFVKRLTYGLDDANNRTQVQEEGSPPEVYAVQDSNDPQGPSNRYAQVGGVAPIYDNRGNTRFDGQRYYVYDYLNRLSEVYMVAPLESSATQSTATSSTSVYAVTDVRVLERARADILRRVGSDVRTLLRSVRDPAVADRLKQSVRGGVYRLTGGGVFGSTVVSDPQLVLLAVYQYDVFNRRTSRIIVGAQTYVYAWDGWREAQEAVWSASGSAPTQQYVWGATLDELVAYRNVGASTDVYYLTQGGQDTPARLLDGNGNVLEIYEYGPYGQATVFNVGGGNYKNPFRWKGMRVDPETGLGYRRNRYYSFAWGRFLTHDPLGVWADAVGWGNGYAYVGNRPGTHRDPMGLQGGGMPRPWQPPTIDPATGTWDMGGVDTMVYEQWRRDNFPRQLSLPLPGSDTAESDYLDLLWMAQKIALLGRNSGERTDVLAVLWDACTGTLTFVIEVAVEESLGTVGAVYFTTVEIAAGNFGAAALEAVAFLPGLPRPKRVEQVGEALGVLKYTLMLHNLPMRRRAPKARVAVRSRPRRPCPSRR